MGIRERFSLAEWADLCAAPFAAGMYVATASGGQLQYTREMTALVRAVRRSVAHGGPIAEAIGQEFGGRFANKLGTGEDAIMAHERGEMLALVQRAGTALERAGGEAAPAYRRWVYGLAAHVASAARDGGVLGLGGRTVAAAEQAALAAISAALGERDSSRSGTL
ncbi:MAG: hypothetical protein HXY37_09465 [Chloroflexi bacterium]|nr:hypothetical protein [Chloroflexota bacterium]